MRILHVTDGYLPRVGGIELHVADLAARQRAAGHRVTVLTGEPASTGRGTDADAEVGVIRLPRRPGAAGGAGRADLERALDAARPHVVHAHLSVASPFAWGALRRADDVPRLATLHSMLPARPVAVGLAARLVRLPLEEIAWTAVSGAAAHRLAASLPQVPVGVLHNGIDPEVWRVEHRPTGHFEIVVVGRLAGRKRPLVVLDALSRLRDLAPTLRWRATFVGDGPQRRHLVTAIRQLRLGGHVRLLGPQPRSRIRDLLGEADVFVAAATLESFGIAALEARCAGVPIVAMAGSGVAEFVAHGVHGLLVEDDAAITAALVTLAHDGGYAWHLREQSRRTPTGMEWSTVLSEHDETYHRVRGGVPSVGGWGR